MKISFSLLLFLLQFESNAQTTNDSLIEKYKNEILKTDIAFNTMCQAKGMARTFIEFAADEVVIVRQDQHPIIGINVLKERYSASESQPKLSWHPVKADVSSSGDLGYTFGNWELAGKSGTGNDTISYGVYISIWKKQNDGNWKYVFDGGNSTPPPTKKSGK